MCLKTINIDDIESIGLEQVIIDKIKEGVKNVSKIKSTILDEITVRSTDTTIVCTKMLVHGKKEISFSFTLDDILSMKIIQIKKTVYVDVISKKYKKRNLTL